MNTLIVIDMINGFCRPGFSLSIPNYKTTIESFISNRIKSYLDSSFPVIFCCDSHSVTDPEMKQYREHCLAGTYESEMIDSLKIFLPRVRLIKKNTLSVFYNTTLNKELSQTKPEKVEIVGVCTDICVYFAAYELRNRGYKVVVPEKGVLSLDSSKQDEFLRLMNSYLGVEVEYAQ